MNLIANGRPVLSWRHAVTRVAARFSQPVQTAWLVLLTVVMATRFAWVYSHKPLAPDNTLPASTWFQWADQGAYYLSTRGWATLDLSASQHLYPSGYALLAAPFYWLFPAEPFAAPNLLCWMAALWLFAALGDRLLGGVRGGRALAATVFALVEIADSRVLYTWEVPWTSTPAATLTFAALLLAVRHLAEPSARLAFVAATCAGLVALVRPTDALIVMPVVGLVAMFVAISHRHHLIRWLGAAALGFAIGPSLLVATHLLTQGWALGRYFSTSRLIGFEPLLLPLRWVTLVLGPQPLYPTGEGIAFVYPYVLPGLAGIIVAMLADTGRRVAHAAVGGGAVAMLCLYLCYRDLQVFGLFTIGNQHYFKWTIPIFGLYALLLPVVTWRRRCWGAAAGGILAVLLLSLWRPVVMPGTLQASVLPDGSGLSLPNGLAHVDDRLDVRAPDDFLAIYYGNHTIDGPDRAFLGGVDFKLVPVRRGLSVVPMRLIPGPTTLHLAPPLRLDPASPVSSLRQAIVFGLPCAIRPSATSCQQTDTIPP